MFVIKLNDRINCQIAQHTATVLNYVDYRYTDTDMRHGCDVDEGSPKRM